MVVITRYAPDETCIDCGTIRNGKTQAWRHGRCSACYYLLDCKRRAAMPGSSAIRRVTFKPKDATAREVCIETLDERGKPWHEEGALIVWQESDADYEGAK